MQLVSSGNKIEAEVSCCVLFEPTKKGGGSAAALMSLSLKPKRSSYLKLTTISLNLNFISRACLSARDDQSLIVKD
ncbi:hypothetical protein L1987_62160 [Smallanthus sonchifolius]|uniref:Uncharacterized protein n=1 Tax=Smallanthus sonchifolius TaxID=185202 RepID=A0ACB9C9R6_9ASTR|nr:hypothetical protein L1987_62160 [Smallanthus sonchifolius]